MQAGTEPSVLTARPRSVPPGATPDRGLIPLGLEAVRDSLLYVPSAPAPDRPAALVLVLHGAGGDARAGLSLLAPVAEEYNLVVLAPASRSSTWDAVRSAYGPDVDVIDRALDRVFGMLPVDPQRVAVGGFSDGASYALGLGLANGDLFSRIIAFSPGFVPAAPRTGRPEIFISHGTGDNVLPIGRTSRRILPVLRRDGYEPTYREFQGPHTVPPEVLREACDWLTLD